MALSASHLVLLSLLAAVFISPTAAQRCKSQTFSSGNTTFANCTDLPTLRASLHWTYDLSAATLSVAFLAPPAAADGWIAWAINPTAGGMIGAQSLIAFKASNGSLVVNTYNISSYSSIAESPIAYRVLSRRAELSGGVMRILATVALPAPPNGAVNQVWQVGSAVKNGVPVKHDFKPDNLNSKSVLQLVGQAEVPAPAPSTSIAGAPTGTQSGNETGGGWRVGRSGLGLYGALVLLGAFLGFC